MKSFFLQIIFTGLLLLGICSAAPLPSGLSKRVIEQNGEESVEKRAIPTVYGAGTKVTNTLAYTNNANIHDGLSTVSPSYTYYSGLSANFPDKSKWLSFQALFEANIPILKQSCGWNGWGPNNGDRHITWIKRYVQQVARDSLVDHRIIFAVIMQESGGCLRAPTTNNGVINPGIMQSHNGVAFNPAAPVTTIRQMIIDGTQGTAYGYGLVQLINQYGDLWMALRGYNSGSIHPSGDLSQGNGATPCYVSDIANRLTGWTLGPNLCRG
ncbi:hypothetical protein ABW19_dt0200313 [Dactylella cylindrospora]|nr:hypothetical protein ABW19_dt0200313 [Dactylella cylindrospora]